MRILKLRFQNLNSLAGEWTIDFTAPAYTSGAIFAIIGQTGSGKTTILDAITLALYGKTPRLDNISQKSNELMTRRTKECFAEVEFETSKGKFTCRWSHKRTQRSQYPFQSPKHEFFDEKGEHYASKKTDVNIDIINVTGLDFKQFIRSVLLAQGEFAAFLDADPKKERAPILEKITDTEIYTTISKEVHIRASKEEKILKELQTEKGGIEVLTTEEEVTLNKNKDQKQKNETDLSKTLIGHRESIEWRKRLESLENDVCHLKAKKDELDNEKIEAKSKLECLELAKKAKIIEPEFDTLTKNREQQNADLEVRQKCLERQQTVDQLFKDAEREEQEVKTKLDTLTQNWDEEYKIIKQIRGLDLTIKHETSPVNDLEIELQGIVEKCEEERINLTKCITSLEETRASLQQSEDYLSKHQNDKTINESIPALNPSIDRYQTLYNNLKTKRTQLIGVENNLTDSENLCRNQKRDLDEKKKLQSSKNNEIDELKQKISNLLKNEKISIWRKNETVLDHDIAKINRLKESAESSIRSDSEIKRLDKEKEKLSKTCSDHVEKLDKLYDEKKKLTEHIDDLEKQVYEQNQVRDLDEKRKLLEDYKPCPLCGSLDHPYAKGNVPVPDETIKELEQCKLRLKKNSGKISEEEIEKEKIKLQIEQNDGNRESQSKQVKNADQEWTQGCQEFGFDNHTADKISAIISLLEIKKSELMECHYVVETVGDEEERLEVLNTEVNELKIARSDLELAYKSTVLTHKSQRDEKVRLKEEIDRDTNDLASQRDIIKQAFGKYDYSETDPEEWSDILTQLSGRYREYKRQLELKQDLEGQKNTLDGKTDTYRQKIKELKKSVNDKNNVIIEKKKNVEKISIQRKSLYGEKDPDEEEKRITASINETRTALEESRTKKHECDKSLRSVVERIKNLNDKIEVDSKALKNLETKFLLSLQNAGFADEITFLNANLSADTFEEYKNLKESLDNEETRLHGLIQDRKNALALEHKKNLSELSLDKLLEENEKLDFQLKEIQRQIWDIDDQLKTNADAKTKSGDLQTNLEKQKIESDRWNRLNDLIGSSTGTTFQIIAQKLTFKQLIAHANQHLRSLSDRYLLVPSEKVDMDMDVIDNYQAGERRSTKNLSGGESFIVSLALALGLSSMSSKKVQIDSFFLDEGFGTLDDESLDMALVTLSGLQQAGKLIGIISHVPAIKERISTRIIVEKKSGGRSRLKGPGVKPPKQVRSS